MKMLSRVLAALYRMDRIGPRVAVTEDTVDRLTRRLWGDLRMSCEGYAPNSVPSGVAGADCCMELGQNCKCWALARRHACLAVLELSGGNR